MSRETDETKKRAVLELVDKGSSYSEISNLLQVGKATISRIVKKEKGELSERKISLEESPIWQKLTEIDNRLKNIEKQIELNKSN